MKHLLVELYPPYKKGHAPYDPSSVEGLSYEERERALKRSFMTSVNAIEGRRMVMDLSETGRIIIQNPGPNTREIAHGIPYVARTYDL